MLHRANRTDRAVPTLMLLLALTACGGEGPGITNVDVDPDDPATIVLDRAEIRFSAMERTTDPESVVVRVTNGGDVALTGLSAAITYSGESGWLTAELDGSTAPASLRFDASIAGLRPGAHEASVRLSADGAVPAVTVDVQLELEAAPEIGLSVSEVTWQAMEGESISDRTVQVTNVGGGVWSGLGASTSYAPGGSAGWVRLDLGVEENAGTLTLGVNAGALEPGRHVASIVVEASDPVLVSDTVQLVLELEAAPEPLPNLVVVGDWTVQEEAEPGESVELPDIRVRNSGDGAAGIHQFAVYLSTDAQYSEDDAILGVQSIQGLDVGAEVESSLPRVGIPSSKDDGDYHLLLVLDHLSIIDESDESDNVVAAAIRVRAAEPSPDPARYTLSRTIFPAESGSFTPSPHQADYEEGTEVVLTAVPSAGYRFVAWSGDHTGTDNPTTVTVDRDLSIRAEFEAEPPAPETFTVSRTVAPAQSGTISLSPSRTEYEAGTEVEITANPQPGYRFVRWGGGHAGVVNPTTVTVDRDLSIEAVFAVAPPELRYVQDSGDIQLEWTFVWPCPSGGRTGCPETGEERYRVEESVTSSTSGYREIHETGVTRRETFQLAVDRSPGTYYFRVRADDGRNLSDYSNVVEVVVPDAPPATVPAAPSGVAAVASTNVVTVTWEDLSDNETGFRVEVSDESAFRNPDEIEVGPNETSATWTGPTDPMEVFVRVRSFNDVGLSSPSEVVSVLTTSANGFVRIVNDSRSLYVNRLRIDATEYVTISDTRIRPKRTRTIELEPGTHTYLMELGRPDDPPTLTLSGDLEITANDTIVVEYSDPTPEEMLLQDNEVQQWRGTFRDGIGRTQTVLFTFRDDFTYTLDAPGFAVGSGVWRLLEEVTSTWWRFVADTRTFSVYGDRYAPETLELRLAGPPSEPVLYLYPVLDGS